MEPIPSNLVQGSGPMKDQPMLNKLLSAFLIGLCFAAGFATAQVLTRSVQLSQDPTSPIGVDANNHLYLVNNNHLNAVAGNAPPVLGTCAGGTLVAGSTDFSGQVSGSSGTSCIVTFGRVWGAAPRCVSGGSISSATTGPVSNTTSTTAITMTVAVTGAGVFTYICNSTS
jgi:hypothetical protein